MHLHSPATPTFLPRIPSSKVSRQYTPSFLLLSAAAPSSPPSQSLLQASNTAAPCSSFSSPLRLPNLWLTLSLTGQQILLCSLYPHQAAGVQAQWQAEHCQDLKICLSWTLTWGFPPLLTPPWSEHLSVPLSYSSLVCSNSSISVKVSWGRRLQVLMWNTFKMIWICIPFC